LSAEGVDKEGISIFFFPHFRKDIPLAQYKYTPVSNSGTQNITGSKAVGSAEITHRTPTKFPLGVSLMKPIWNVGRISEKND